jgi:cytochrome c peroxidase
VAYNTEVFVACRVVAAGRMPLVPFRGEPVVFVSKLFARSSRSILLPGACVGLIVSVGCAPAGGPIAREDVVEIETIEMAPAATEKSPSPAADTAKAIDASRQDVDARTAAADQAISAAATPAAATEVAIAEKPPLAIPPADPRSQQPAEKVELGDPSLTAGVPGTGPITLAQIDAWLAEPKNFRLLEPVLPLGLSQGAGQITGLESNPLTRAKIELGRQLYFDTRLSADSTVSCASCHDPSMAYTAHTKTGVGIRGQLGGRNSPVSFNRILSGKQFWDGRVDSLEAQAVGPIQNPIEMGFTHEGVVKRLSENPVYKKQFDAIFGELTIDRVGQAIAAFERAIVTSPAPYDYHEQLLPFATMDEGDIADDEELAAKFKAAKAAAETHPMSDSAKAGRDLFFGKANCTACHVGANLADEKYHNLGVGMEKPEPDLGRFVVTKEEADRGAFKTPTVRNAALTAPYMHDGSVATLEEVVEWYDKGGHPNPQLSDKIKPLNLTADEKAALVEFMKACTSPTPAVEIARLPE